MLKSLAGGSINRRCCYISYSFQKEGYIILRHHKCTLCTPELAVPAAARASGVVPVPGLQEAKASSDATREKSCLAGPELA